jgi:rfaE bifunctional protein nucleotidyltransferase chain/domain
VSARILEDYRDLAEQLADRRGADRGVGLANGCFDVLHVGHVRLLREASAHVEVLVVALNSDASARALKGPGRPHVPLEERMEIVAALAGVDWVTSFPEPTADAIVDTLQPAVLIKGTDRTPEAVPERARLAAYGGRVLICGDPKSGSSTELVEKVRRS